MNQRQEYILKTLIRQTTPIELSKLQRSLDISMRTLKDDLKNIEQFLYPIKKKLYFDDEKHQIYLAFADKIAIQDAYRDYEQSSSWLPTEEKQRRLFLLYYLIQYNNQFLSIEHISEKIFFSKTLVTKDLHKLSKWIYKITGKKISFSKAQGVRLSLSELEIRKMIRSSIHQYYFVDSKYLMNLFFQVAPSLSTEEDFLTIKKIIFTALFQQQKLTDHESFATLILEVLIICQRIHDKHSLEEEIPDQAFIVDFPFDQLEQAFSITFSNAERKYLAQSLEGMRFANNVDFDYQANFSQQIIYEFLESLQEMELVSAALPFDARLFSWINHLNHRLFEYSMNVESCLPFPEQAVHEVSYLLPIVEQLVPIAQKYTGISLSQQDLYFQALHLKALNLLEIPKLQVALVSNYSIITVNRLISHLRFFYSDVFEITITTTTDYFFNSANKQADLIIATNTIYETLPIIPVYISGEFTSEDKMYCSEVLLGYVKKLLIQRSSNHS